MAALRSVNAERLYSYMINRETLFKYKNYRRLTFPVEVICTIKKLKIKKSFRGCRVRGEEKERGTWAFILMY